MRIRILAAVLALSIAGTAAIAQANFAQVSQFTTPKEFAAAGAVKLSAAEFAKKVVGKKMDGDGWSWIIKKNGTTDSIADDGSWKEVAAPWTMEGDQYCIVDKGKQKCRDVYLLGKFMRMAEKSGKLSPWTAQLK